jgi:hypothetical protein
MLLAGQGATLERLSEVLKQPRWAKNAMSQGELRAAETLIDCKTSPEASSPPEKRAPK